MPVVTRSQSRKLQEQELEIQKLEYMVIKDSFVARQKQLIELHHNSSGRENRIKTSIDIFKLINNELPYILENCAKYDTPNTREAFLRFALSINAKVREYNETIESGLPNVDQELVNELVSVCARSKQIVNKYI